MLSGTHLRSAVKSSLQTDSFNSYPPKESSVEPLRGVPFGLSALFHYVIGQILFGFPYRNQSLSLIVWWVCGWGVFWHIQQKAYYLS